MYSDGSNGRCAVSVLVSYFGWNGRDDYNAISGLFTALAELKHAGIDEDLLINLNNSGYSFDEIANYLDEIDNMPFIVSC
jgi:hypothetical protein